MREIICIINIFLLALSVKSEEANSEINCFKDYDVLDVALFEISFANDELNPEIYKPTKGVKFECEKSKQIIKILVETAVKIDFNKRLDYKSLQMLTFFSSKNEEPFQGVVNFVRITDDSVYIQIDNEWHKCDGLLHFFNL